MREDWERNRAVCNQIVQIAGMYRSAEVNADQGEAFTALADRAAAQR